MLPIYWLGAPWIPSSPAAFIGHMPNMAQHKIVRCGSWLMRNLQGWHLQQWICSLFGMVRLMWESFEFVPLPIFRKAALYKPSLLVMDSLFRSCQIQAVCPAAAGPRIQAADVADWATVKDPEVRLLQPDGTLLERFLPAAVASGQLHRVAMVKAQELANEGIKKLELLALKFPGKVCLACLVAFYLNIFETHSANYGVNCIWFMSIEC